MDTKKIIIDSFQNLLANRKFESITVQDILDEAHCARGTFYRHFKDKYDVMNSFYYTLSQQIHSDPTLGGRQQLRMIIDSLIENAHYFKKVTDTQGANGFQMFVKTYSREYFLGIYREHTQPDGPIPDRIFFMADFLSAGYSSVLKEWIIHRNGLSEDELTECLYAMTPKEFKF